MDTITIEGTVDSVLYCDPDSGYIVLDLDIGSDYVTVTGNIGVIEEGEAVRVTGEYIEHPKFGDQFRAEVCERKLPATASAILKYLASGAVKGVGPSLARKIVDKFGADSLTVIEESPEKLSDIKGISISKAEEISQEFRRIHGVRTLMIFLEKYRVVPSIAMAAWKRWGQFAIEMIKADPYVLCNEEVGLGFESADRIAADMGIAADSPGRVKAGLIHVLSHNMMNGHTCIPTDKLIQKSSEMLGISETTTEEVHEAACDEHDLFVYENEGREYTFLPEMYRAEKNISSRLMLMMSCFKDTGADNSKLIDIEEKTKLITYAEKQREAISKALSGGLLILTGGPGTGKTTTLKAIISLYEQKGLKVTITAPTGRAAKRVSDLTGYQAKTIHRLLEVMYDNAGFLRFKHNENDQLPTDVMIVDEMSMVDTLLFDALLRAMKLSCRLIMVGDSDQLPSVGAGNVLRDMIDSGKLNVVSLNEIFRQAEQSLIITNAHRIVNGEFPDISRTDSDFFFMQRYDIEEAAQTVAELCMRRLPDAYGYNTDDIQVLCPSRKGKLGTVELNKRLQQCINPLKSGMAEIHGMTFVFRDGDKVMQTKNNYDITWERDGEKGSGIYNGDIGTIVKVKRSEATVMIDFEGRIAEYNKKTLEEVELAYAVTVHKSQGSEFNAVIIPLLGYSDKLYYRNLIYTAVTRAKKQLIIVGSPQIMQSMVENNRRTLRYTCLKDRLINEQED